MGQCWSHLNMSTALGQVRVSVVTENISGAIYPGVPCRNKSAKGPWQQCMHVSPPGSSWASMVAR